MTDHHPTERSEHHGIRRHGVTPPPPDDVLNVARRGMARGALPEMTMPLHFWEQGPLLVEPVAQPYRLKLRDGSNVTITHKKYWYLDKVEGTTRRKALKAIYDVLLHPRSWSRAGVHWVRVTDPAQATLFVSIAPTTVCGEGAAGCFSWGWPDGKERSETLVQYIDRPGPFAVIFGMESCGHPLRALDHYNAVHQGYEGVMGTWESAARCQYYPLDHEIESARLWLRGELPASVVHDD